MGKIKKLSPQVINEIAAGEVVERPASVLKELVENSIDAGAKSIRISYLEGGLQRLRVVDDGEGISADDLPRVFESHATSKIKALDDFETLCSLGFRGEAMSSISAVSKLQLSSSQKEEALGHRLKIEFGQLGEVEQISKRVGTEVLVEDLFSRLPVRQKFLKSAAAEARRLRTVFQNYALFYPDLHLRFGLDGEAPKEELLPSSFRKRVAYHFSWGEDDRLFEVETKDGPWKIHFVSQKPRFWKAATRRQVLISLNKRPIQDRGLEMALRRAFEGYAENYQAMLAAMMLEGPATDFDVNVHPAKSEVRFLHPEALFSFVVRSLKAELQKIHQEHWSTSQSRDKESVATVFDGVTASEAELPAVAASPAESGEEKPFSGRAAATETLSFGPLDTALKTEQHQQAVFITPTFTRAKFEYLGSIERTYLIAKKSEKLFLFDQHALHERVLYEEMKAQFDQEEKLTSQRLLFPISISLPLGVEWNDEDVLYESLGFELRHWKEGELQILSAPSLLKRQIAQSLQELLQIRENSRESLIREAVATLACHAAIRAHDPISEMEARDLFEKFGERDALGHCPHGRPTFVEMSAKDLSRFFNRPA